MFKIRFWYLSAMIIGVASLLFASGIESAASFGGMVGYALISVAVFSLTIPCLIRARKLEIRAEKSKKVHKYHAWPYYQKEA